MSLLKDDEPDKKYYRESSETGSLIVQRGSMASTSDDTVVALDEESDGESNTTLVGCWPRFWASVKGCCFPPKVYHARRISLSGGTLRVDSEEEEFPANEIRNQKYNPFTFLFVVLYEQFKFFFNLYFLLVALSQFIPALQVGFLFTYLAPLIFVLSITIAKEAYDDFQRYKRDKEANSQSYHRLAPHGMEVIKSAEIRVGDFIKLEKNERVPADMILLRTSEKGGATFIRTDQLDGETDWKLRKAVQSCNKLPSDDALWGIDGTFFVNKPKKDIYNFVGKFTLNNGKAEEVDPLNIENTLWMNTVVASGTVIGMVIYTGSETRSVMNTSVAQTKVGLLDLELNNLSKVLFGLLVILSFLMVALNHFKAGWAIDMFRFVLLFSSIIPISLRVNLDMGKTLYSLWIMRDDKIEGTIVRSSTIPEELGRISYLLSDKTGTLTQNEMVFKRLHLGSTTFSKETVDEIQAALQQSYQMEELTETSTVFSSSRAKSRRIPIEKEVRNVIEALALCHNVTPTYEEEDSTEIVYQASSPDEIALVKFTESIGLTLVARDLTTMTLLDPLGGKTVYNILDIFPFSSETKRMGIILENAQTGQITFYMKGADVVMAKIVKTNDWLEEECGNMAREGLRTLVFGMKDLTREEFDDFARRLKQARASMSGREKRVESVIESLETDLNLIGLTGVEDKLQDNVQGTLEMLRNAGIKIWMLTGDKVETATCIAISARLVSKNQSIYTIANVEDKNEALNMLKSFGGKKDTALVLDGRSLQFCIDNCPVEFMEVSCKAPAVVCCRCSPTQKALVVTLIKEHTKLQTCAVGDGGNDVSMIQAADVGLGIVGKEGKQASLAADFSINQFSFIARLLIWHGRNSYKRSASLGQFIIHRGLIISFIQAVFSSLFYFAAISIYNGWLLVGYATVYTMAPVFSLVLDTDVTEDIAFQFPELYRELQKGRCLSYRTFFLWNLKSIYQGGLIMMVAIFLFDSSMYNIVSITFTALILTELLNVAFEIHTWHWMMIVSEIGTLVLYFVSMLILKSYFDMSFIASWNFFGKITAITAITVLPIGIGKFIKKKCDPPAYAKLQQARVTASDVFSWRGLG